MDLRFAKTPVSLVVAERGSDWEAWVERFSTGTPDVRVVVQDPEEPVERLAQRVRAQVLELEERKPLGGHLSSPHGHTNAVCSSV